jgi:hypothetical protein
MSFGLILRLRSSPLDRPLQLRELLLPHAPMALRAELHELVLHLEETLDDPGDPDLLVLRRVLAGQVAELDLHEVLELHLSADELLRELLQFARRGRRPEHRGRDLLLRRFDPLRDRDLALAVEERDLPHLAQVHAHRVVVADRLRHDLLLDWGDLEFLGLPQALDLLERLVLGLEDVDVHLAESDVRALHLLDEILAARGGIEELIDLVVRHVSLTQRERLQLRQLGRFRFAARLALHRAVRPPACTMLPEAILR